MVCKQTTAGRVMRRTYAATKSNDQARLVPKPQHRCPRDPRARFTASCALTPLFLGVETIQFLWFIIMPFCVHTARHYPAIAVPTGSFAAIASSLARTSGLSAAWSRRNGLGIDNRCPQHIAACVRGQPARTTCARIHRSRIACVLQPSHIRCTSALFQQIPQNNVMSMYGQQTLQLRVLPLPAI